MVWDALFDAAVLLVTKGFPEQEVYGMSPDTFERVYHSLKRQEARDDVKMLYLMNQANNGDKKSITAFSDVLGQWLPSQETGSKSGLGKYRALMQGKGKLKKMGRR